MPPQFHHRTTKKEPRCSPPPTAALEERTEEIRDRGQKAGDNHVERVAAPEEYLTLTRAHEGETWFDAGAWTEDLAGSYLALGRVDDAVRAISNPQWLPVRARAPVRRNSGASGPGPTGGNR